MEASWDDVAELEGTGLHNVGLARFGVMWAQPDPPEVKLAVIGRDNQSTNYQLRPGDTFPVGHETWRLDGVWPAGTYESRVVVRRVDDPATAPPVPAAVEPGSLPQPAGFTAFGMVVEADIRALEARLQRELPGGYRQWLAETNGGYPSGDAGIPGVPFTLFAQRPLLGIFPDDPSRDLWHAEGEREALLPKDYVVIGRPSGGWLTVQVTPPYTGGIAFLSEVVANEAPAGPQRTTYLATRQHMVAEDIRDFIAKLRLHPSAG